VGQRENRLGGPSSSIADVNWSTCARETQPPPVDLHNAFESPVIYPPMAESEDEYEKEEPFFKTIQVPLC